MRKEQDKALHAVEARSGAPWRVEIVFFARNGNNPL
jgi:hypothetical protein